MPAHHILTGCSFCSHSQKPQASGKWRTAMQNLKLPLEMPASHTDILVHVLVPPLPIQFPANAPWEAEMMTQVLGLPPMREIHMELQAPGFFKVWGGISADKFIFSLSLSHEQVHSKNKHSKNKCNEWLVHSKLLSSMNVNESILFLGKHSSWICT